MNDEQAPRRDKRVERAIRELADKMGGDPLWPLRRPYDNEELEALDDRSDDCGHYDDGPCNCPEPR